MTVSRTTKLDEAIDRVVFLELKSDDRPTANRARKTRSRVKDGNKHPDKAKSQSEKHLPCHESQQLLVKTLFLVLRVKLFRLLQAELELLAFDNNEAFLLQAVQDCVRVASLDGIRLDPSEGELVFAFKLAEGHVFVSDCTFNRLAGVDGVLLQVGAEQSANAAHHKEQAGVSSLHLEGKR